MAVRLSDELEREMKRHLSSLIFGSLGLCVGFTLCYLYIVLPERTAKGTGAQKQFVVLPTAAQDRLGWQPYWIHPTIPPKIVGQ